jgi:MoaA/NifB/PqqE/SkfB family radical SAM enzyme
MNQSILNNFYAVTKISRSKISEFHLPIKLTIGLTYKCQSRCNSCDIWKLYHVNPEKSADELPAEAYFRLFDTVCKDVLWLEFTGGEPFLRKDISQIVSYAINNTQIMAAGITTNGLKTDKIVENVRRILKASNGKQLIIGVSLDGDKEMYKKVRGVDGFALASKTFFELKKLQSSFVNLRPHIAYTINHINSGSFQDCYNSVLKKMGIRIEDMSFTIEHPFGFYFQNGKHPHLAKGQYQKNALSDIDAVVALRSRTGKTFSNPASLFYEYYLQNISTYFEKPSQQLIPCKACDFSAYVDPLGRVYPCTMWNRTIGNIKDTSFSRIWGSQIKQETKRMIRHGNCPNCWTPCEAQPSWLMNLGLLRGWW